MTARLSLLILGFLFSTGILSAQYQVFSWDNFEEGHIPAAMRFGYMADPSTVQVVRWANMPNYPNLKGGVATTENRNFGLRFAPVRERNHLSIMNAQMNLQRERLGAQGRALYQADFYLPPEGADSPTISLLAAVYEEGSTSIYRFYRFGVINNERLFFSYTDGGEAPEIYHQQNLSELNVQRPGWNRFQIIFLGPDQIYCAVDGEMTSFSPVREGTLRNLNSGIMVTLGEARQNTVAFADNLSIQWTPQQAPLPHSPWRSGPVAIAGETSAVGRNTKLFAEDSVVNWTGDPSAAWRYAQAEQRPVLALFSIPNIPPMQYLVDLSPDDQEARRLLEQYVLLRIDANQLGGGQVAHRFGVVRFPTLIAVDPRGNETARLTVLQGRTSWDEVAATLRQGVGG